MRLSLEQLQEQLERVAERSPIPGDCRVYMIVEGVAYPIHQVWFESGQDNGRGAICIGDDPR